MPSTSQLVDEEIKSLNSTFPSFQLVQSLPISLENGTSPAQVIEFTYNDGATGAMKVMKVINLRDNNAYKITYFAQSDKYDSYLPIVREMMNSFQINELANENVSSTNTGASGIPQSGTEGFLTFKHPSLGFSLQYSSNWTAAEKDELPDGTPTGARIAPGSMSYPSIDVDDLSTYSNIDSLQSAVDSLDPVLESTENQLLSSSRSNRSNLNDAFEFMYIIGAGQDPKSKVLDIFTRNRDGSIYNINFAADLKEFDQLLPVVNQIINSFQIS